MSVHIQEGVTIADEVYILMRNAAGKYLKYADLEFQDLAEKRASCIIHVAAAAAMPLLHRQRAFM